MARYKHIDTSPRFIAVDLERQLQAGTFEHALNYLVDHELDLTRFDARYKNDFTGATAYPPAMLLKVVLFAYSRGIVSSREIERACRDHVTFIALSGDSAPHFTTFAAFVGTLGNEIGPLFQEILLICDRRGSSAAKCSPSTASSCPVTPAKPRAAPVPTSSARPPRWKPPRKPCSPVIARTTHFPSNPVWPRKKPAASNV